MEKLKNRFIIITPMFNAGNSIVKCITSILEQNFVDLGIIIRDDMSTDDCQNILRDFLGMEKNQNLAKINGKDILIVSNSNKLYGGGNTYDSAINYLNNEEAIVGVVDADDFLISDNALTKIYNLYQNKDVWQIWSQHQAKSLDGQCPKGYSSKLPTDNIIYSSRNYWSVSHFRTCKAWLFHKIRRKDLYDPFNFGSFCQFAADASIIYPITEMCGNEKSFFLDEVLYFYNDDLPANESNISREDVKKYTKYIRDQQSRYSKIKGALNAFE